MRPQREASIADGFWISLALAAPPLALAAFSNAPEAAVRAALLLGATTGLAAMALPFMRRPAEPALAVPPPPASRPRTVRPSAVRWIPRASR
jgi:hypothetical protein